MADALHNFSYSTVATAPSPATSGTSLVVAAGDGTKFAVGNAVCWPPNVQPSVANAEIVRVTAISTDTLTITRAQESTTALSIAVGWQIDQGVTAGLLAQYLALSGGTMSGAIAMGANKITGLANGTAATDAAAFGQLPGALTYVQSFITTAATLTTANTFYAVTSLSLSAGTWDISFVVFIDGYGKTAVADPTYHALVGPTSASFSGAYLTTSHEENALTDDPSISLSGRKVVVLTGATTVYLNCSSSLAGVSVDGQIYGAGDCSGITAVKIA